jgi:hypothetical protein
MTNHSRSRKRNMAGTARCLDCGARAEYASDSTLVIRHTAECPNRQAE